MFNIISAFNEGHKAAKVAQNICAVYRDEFITN